MRNLYDPNNFRSPEGERNGELHGDHCLSLTVHLPRPKIVRTPVTSHQAGAKENGLPWLELQELRPQVLLSELTRTPCAVEALEAMPTEPLPCLRQKLEIRCDRDDVLVVFPFLTDMKVAEDLGRCVRLERSLYE
jgi:hypothetical protein